MLLSNLVGTAIFAGLLQFKGVFSPEISEAPSSLSRAPYSGTFGVTLLRGVFAGWLIALMVWLLPSARSARLLTILLVTYTVGAAHLAHVVAGSAEAVYAILTGGADVFGYLVAFLLPTLLGNTIGGVAMVAIVNHASIAPEITDAQRNS